MDIKLLKQIFNKPTIETAKKEIPKLILGIAGFICALLICIPPIMGGEEGVMLQAYLVYALLVCVVIACLFVKNSSLRWMMLTVAASAFIGYQVIFKGATNNFPEAIRSIQGEYFVISWLLYALGAYGAVFLIQLTCNVTVSRSVAKMKKLHYSHSDIMLINGYSIYKYIGYFVLKAKADGLIKFKYLDKQEELAVELDERAVSQLCDSYYRDEPVMKQLIDFLKERMSFGRLETTVWDIIMRFEPDIDISSSGGKAVAKRVFKADTVKNVLICVAIYMVYYVGISKLIMGMCNDKELFNLIIYGFPISYIMTWQFIKLMQWSFCRKAEQCIWSPVCGCGKSKLKDFEARIQNLMVDEGNASEDEKTELLNQYALDYDTANRYWYKDSDSDKKYAYAFLNNISEAEKRDREDEKRIRDYSGSGSYYGCSSCGGCGGGGCGGCGD